MVKTIKSWKKKSIILTIDAIIAITLVTLILLATTNYSIRSHGDFLSGIQLVRSGNDILNLLDSAGDFEEWDAIELHENLNELLSPTYEMKVILTLKNGDSIETISETIPINRFVGTGERVFVIEEGDIKFGIARFWIWSKN
tara:strand:+ start:111 stop:536 length:426 start_codon:yes stop_codon:yes gene_type:complete